MNNEATVEGLKEFLRVVVIAAVSAALVAALAWATKLQDVTVQAVLVALLTAAGKAWDKFIHKNPDIPAKGLVPF